MGQATGPLSNSPLAHLIDIIIFFYPALPHVTVSLSGEMWATVATAAAPLVTTRHRHRHRHHVSVLEHKPARFLNNPVAKHGPRLPPVVPTHSPFRSCTSICRSFREEQSLSTSDDDDDVVQRRVLKIVLWGAEAVYILWLFLLPYAPVVLLFC